MRRDRWPRSHRRATTVKAGMVRPYLNSMSPRMPGVMDDDFILDRMRESEFPSYRYEASRDSGAGVSELDREVCPQRELPLQTPAPDLSSPPWTSYFPRIRVQDDWLPRRG